MVMYNLLQQLHNIMQSMHGVAIDVYKAGQTKFTVYRHKVFDFACGRAVIIQISNQ